MKLSQVDKLLTESVAVSKEFKTHSTFGYQPVIASRLFKELLEIYISHFRPVAAANNEGEDMSVPGAPLFLKFSGKRENNVSRRITRYFERKLRLHITATMIRAVMETTGHDMMVAGKITPEIRKAVSQVNTHSSAVTDDYYKLHNTIQDANRVLSVFDPSPDGDIDTTPAPPPVVFVKKLWGSAHPKTAAVAGSKRERRTRVVFSGKELAYMRELIITIPQGHNFVARCLRHIMQDDNAASIFHERHVFKSDRLRAGFRSNFQVDSNDKYLPVYLKKVSV
jgi:hypothetical protein